MKYWQILIVLLMVPHWVYAAQNNTSLDARIEQKSKALKNKVTEQASQLRFFINKRMQNSAQWFDDIAQTDDNVEAASAKGYLSLGLVPRTGDLLDHEAKFKVSFSLPNWQQRLKLVLDNDEDEADRLPFQTALIDKTEQQLNAALKWYMIKRKSVRLDHRLGVRRDQAYIQSRLRLGYQFENWLFNVTPSIEYYYSDGFGARVNTRADWRFKKDHALNFALNLHHIESEPSERVSAGVFHSYNYGNDSTGITGFWALDAFDGERSYYASYRFRKLFYEDWLFFETEPFVEFKQYNDFNDEVGIALRLIGYYG